MALPAVLTAADGRLIGPGAYQTGSSLETAAFWGLLAILIILGAGLVLYIFFVRGSYEREKQAALAMIGSRRGQAAPRDPRNYSATTYTYRGDVPDAVASAMSGLRQPEPEVELVGEPETEGLPAYLYTGRRHTPASRGGAPLPPPRAYDGRVDRPPGAAARGSYASGSHLDDMLGAGEGDRLRSEDRELLREEQLEPEPQAPGLYEDEEVTFEDEPEPEPAVHPPEPYRGESRERPVWEQVLAGAGQAGQPIDVEPEPARPAAAPRVLSRAVSASLLQQEIISSVRNPPPARTATSVRPAGRPAAPEGRRAGPAWSEGRPVFSGPLEEPDVPQTRDVPPPSALEDTLGDISHKLHSMDVKASPRLPPKAEAKMGVQERKFLEALRAVQEKKREEDQARDEEGHRLLKDQMQDLERKKADEEQRRLAEQRRRERERVERERHQREEMARWDEARRATQQNLQSGEEARAEEQRARQEAARVENERRRKARPGQQQPADIDDVLSRIGIK